MTQPVWRWLPDEALSSGGVLAGLDEALAAWSARWFSDFALTRRRLVLGPPSPSLQRVASTPRLDVLAAPSAAFTLLRGALNEDVERIELDDADWTLLDALRDEILGDLAQSIDGALSGPGSAPAAGGSDPSGPVVVELADGAGRIVLAISATRAVLGEARRALLPARRVARPADLVGLASAISQAVVNLDVRIGSAFIPVTEVRRLAPGDVIILDRGLTEPLDLLAETGGVRIAAARLVDAQSPRSLRLEAAPSRERL